MKQLFADRKDAGRQLAMALTHLRGRHPLVLGLARGGLVLAAEVAIEFSGELDVLVARKVGAPQHPEFGIGAVAPGGARVFDPLALNRLGISEAEFDLLAERELQEVDRRLEAYRGGREPLNVFGRTVIVVDDGLATGVTAMAACRFVRSLAPGHLVLAVPVGTKQAREALEREVDELVCLAEPEPFYSVGQWYADFSQVEDEEVRHLLRVTA